MPHCRGTCRCQLGGKNGNKGHAQISLFCSILGCARFKSPVRTTVDPEFSRPGPSSVVVTQDARVAGRFTGSEPVTDPEPIDMTTSQRYSIEMPTPIPADLDRALDRLADALAAMGSGDPAPYAALWPDDPDVTLFGAWGPIERATTR